MKINRKAVFAFACIFMASAPAFAAETIKIGLGGAHTGDLASYGLPTVKAAELVVEEKNAAGGILGKQIELIKEDDACKPEIATNTATKLITSGVQAVIGHICSGATKAAIGIYKGSNLVCISPSATAPDFTLNGDYPNFFRTISHDFLQADLQADFVLNNLKAQKVAIIHDKGEYGKGIATIVKEKIEKAGFKDKVVLFEGVTSGAVDYAAIVQKIRHEKADTIVWGGYHADASKIIKQIRQKKMQINFIGPDGLKDETFIQVAGADAEGVYASGPSTPKNSLAEKAREQHIKKYGEEPGAFFYQAYSATLALLNAIQKAGSTDFAALTKALKSESVDTPVGKISFDKNGDATGISLSMYKVEKGKFVEQVK